MGSGGKKHELHEIAETRAAGRDEAFEKVIERVKSSGGEIIEDDTHPFYTEIGTQEFEIGTERTIEFSLNKADFQLIRKVENYMLQGAGKQKHIEELEIPRIKMTLKKKSPQTNEWQVVDLEEMF